DAIAPEGVAHLVERGFAVEKISSKLPREELFQKIADSEAIITRSSTTVNIEFLAHARRLRFLGRAGVGVDNIDIDAWPRPRASSGAPTPDPGCRPACAPSTWR